MKKLLPLLLVIAMTLSLFCIDASAEADYKRPADLPYGEVLFNEDFNSIPAGKLVCNSPDQAPNIQAIDGGFVRLSVNWDNVFYVLDGTETFTDNVIISLDMKTNIPGRGLIYGLSLRKTDDPVNSGWDIMWAEHQGITPLKRPGNDQSLQFGSVTGKDPVYGEPINITVMIANGKISVYHNGVFLTDLDGTIAEEDGTKIGAMAYYTDVDLDKLVVYAIDNGHGDSGSDDNPNANTSDLMLGCVVLAFAAVPVGFVVSKKRRG